MSHYEILCKYISIVVFPTLKNVKVISYSVVAVVIVGGAGIWVPWLTPGDNFVILSGGTVFTFVFALLGSLVCNRLYFHSEKIKNLSTLLKDNNFDSSKFKYQLEEIENGNVLSAWGLLAGSLIIVLTSICYAYNRESDSIIAAFSLLFSLIFYYVVTASEVSKKTESVSKGDEDAQSLFPLSGEPEVFNAEIFQNGNN